jgi:acetolactate synthase I/II/III large subunit
MYTMQALWTQARAGLNVTSVILSNRAYAILFREYANVGAAQPTKNAHDLMELRRPEIDWVSLAKAHGVPAEKVTDLAGFDESFRPGNYYPWTKCN